MLHLHQDDLVVEVIDTAHADFVSNPDYPAFLPLPGTEIQFADASQGAASWYWDFGDGISGEGHHIAHSFTEEGVYYVTMRQEIVQRKRDAGAVRVYSH